MSLTAGALSQVSVGSNTASLLSAVATSGTAPYAYQWYRSTTNGFTPGAGNLIAGATSLTLNDTGLIPNVTYYYKVVVTDNVSATATSSQLTVVTATASLSQNQFAMAPFLGTIDQRFPYNTSPGLIDVSQATPLYAGSAVKMVDSVDGVPKLVGCSADSDEVLGFINFDVKTTAFVAGVACEISKDGNVIYLYATTAIARGAQVQLDVINGGVAAVTPSSGADIVGWAYDKAVSPGTLIRVFVKTPTFLKA